MSVERETTRLAVKGAVRDMSEQLRERYREIRRLLVETTSTDVRKRHEIGCIVVEVMGQEGTYGARAVPLLADALGRSASTLYRYAAVAKAWNGKELEEILLLKMPSGDPLSWNHLLEIAEAVESPSERARFVNEAVLRGLSVRTLADFIHRAPTRPVRGSKALLPFARFVTRCQAFGRLAFDERWFERLADADPVEASALLQEAEAANEKGLHLFEENLSRLRQAKAKLTSTKPVSHRQGATLPRLIAGGRR